MTAFLTTAAEYALTIYQQERRLPVEQHKIRADHINAG
jgi:hypothetical protein